MNHNIFGRKSSFIGINIPMKMGVPPFAKFALNLWNGFYLQTNIAIVVQFEQIASTFGNRYLYYNTNRIFVKVFYGISIAKICKQFVNQNKKIGKPTIQDICGFECICIGR